MSTGELIGQAIFIIILVLINAFFAGAEMAMVSSNRTKINIRAEQGDKKAQYLLKILERPSDFLSTIQVGITLAGFFASAQAATGLASELGILLAGMNVPYSESIALVLITIIISYFTLVFGELLPKRLALQSPEKVALASVGIIRTISYVTKPFVKLLSASTGFFARLMGIHTDTLDQEVSLEEIRSLIEVGKEKGVINQTERDMLEGIFEFDNKLAREVMTPRTEVDMISIEEPVNNIVTKVIASNFSRIPIYDEDIDNIIGILYIKDLFRRITNNGKPGNIESLLRKPMYAPETKFIDDLFKEMQGKKQQIAILLDEYGGFSGIVTIEDLLEEIVGNMYDEHDTVEGYINKVTENIYIVDGLISIDDFNDYTGFDLYSENTDSIGGYVIEKLGRVPAKGDTVYHFGNEFRVIKMQGRRIKELKVTMKGTDKKDESVEKIPEIDEKSGKNGKNGKNGNPERNGSLTRKKVHDDSEGI